MFHFAYLCPEGPTGIQVKKGETKKSPRLIKIQRWSVWTINSRSLNTSKIFVISAFIEQLQNKLCISQMIQKVLSFLICFLLYLHTFVQKTKSDFKLSSFKVPVINLNNFCMTNYHAFSLNRSNPGLFVIPTGFETQMHLSVFMYLS